MLWSPKRSILCVDPWGMYSYSDNSIQREVQSILWCPVARTRYCVVLRGRANGQWMTAVTGGLFRGKEQKTLSLDFILYDTTQKLQNPLTSAIRWVIGYSAVSCS